MRGGVSGLKNGAVRRDLLDGISHRIVALSPLVETAACPHTQAQSRDVIRRQSGPRERDQDRVLEDQVAAQVLREIAQEVQVGFGHPGLAAPERVEGLESVGQQIHGGIVFRVETRSEPVDLVLRFTPALHERQQVFAFVGDEQRQFSPDERSDLCDDLRVGPWAVDDVFDQGAQGADPIMVFEDEVERPVQQVAIGPLQTIDPVLIR